jgi:hypothetical protein
MSGPWAIRLDWSDAAKTGALRRRPDIEVLQTDDAVWLRGRRLDDELQTALRSVPGARRFSLLPDGQLVAAGTRVPQGHLPDGTWTAISAWLAVKLEPPCLAGKVEGRVSLRLVRSGRVNDSNVLWTTIAAWGRWAVSAPQVRLDRLGFAVGGPSDVVVRGNPLPPIPGRPFVEVAGVAVEAGWECSPPLEATEVREALGLAAGDLALVEHDGSWEHVPADAFVQATRSAVRLTAEAMEGDDA